MQLDVVLEQLDRDAKPRARKRTAVEADCDDMREDTHDASIAHETDCESEVASSGDETTEHHHGSASASGATFSADIHDGGGTRSILCSKSWSYTERKPLTERTSFLIASEQHCLVERGTSLGKALEFMVSEQTFVH
eukprot:6465721-Amphidinium_carterae.1